MSGLYFPFERLDAFRLALSVNRWIRSQTWPRGCAHLRDQAVRAADSMTLNIAEGACRGGPAALNHFRIARGSAGEAAAALMVHDLPEATTRIHELRRVAAMLSKLRAP